MAIPPGVHPVYVSNSDRERHGLPHDLAFKLFPKSYILGNVTDFGKLSMFYKVRPVVEVRLHRRGGGGGGGVGRSHIVENANPPTPHPRRRSPVTRF